MVFSFVLESMGFSNERTFLRELQEKSPPWQNLAVDEMLAEIKINFAVTPAALCHFHGLNSILIQQKPGFVLLCSSRISESPLIFFISLNFLWKAVSPSLKHAFSSSTTPSGLPRYCAIFSMRVSLLSSKRVRDSCLSIGCHDRNLCIMTLEEKRVIKPGNLMRKWHRLVRRHLFLKSTDLDVVGSWISNMYCETLFSCALK